MDPVSPTEPLLTVIIDFALPVATALAGGWIGWRGALANAKRQEHNDATRAVREKLEDFLSDPDGNCLSLCPKSQELIKMLANLPNRDRRRIAPAVDRFKSASANLKKNTDMYGKLHYEPEELEAFVRAAQTLRDLVEVK